MIDLYNQLRVAAAWARQANEPDNSEMLDGAADEIKRLRSEVSRLRYIAREVEMFNKGEAFCRSN